MSKFSKDILNKIQKGEIKPRPRWHFVLWHALLWSSFALSILVGSLVTGMFIFEVRSTAWDLLPHIGFLHILPLLLLPLFWLVILALMLFLGYEAFSNTKKGYKYKPLLIIGLSILISIILGVVVFQANLANRVDQMGKEHFGPYSRWNSFVNESWVKPNMGIIAGQIIEINTEELITVVDYTGEEWYVNITDADMSDLSLEIGMEIMILGRESEDYNFEAKRIRDADAGPPKFLNMEGRFHERNPNHDV